MGATPGTRPRQSLFHRKQERGRPIRAIKVIAWIFGVLLLLVVAAGATLWLGGGRVLAWAVEHPVSALVGRQLRIGGPLVVHWGAPTRIVADDVHVANASWGSAPDMFAAKRLEVEIFLPTLLHGPARLPLISLDGAKLLLETSKDGKRNWDFRASAAAPKKRHQFPELQRFAVAQSELIFHNGQTGARTDLGIAKLDLREPQPTSPVEIAANGTFQQAPIRIAGTVGPIAELRNPQRPYPVKLEGVLDRIRLVVDGTIAEPLDFAGVDARLSLSGAKLQELAGMLGVPLPPFPDFRSTAKLRGGNGRWSLDAITMKTDRSDLEGGIDIDTTGKVPQLVANLTSKFVDLADFKGFVGARPPGSSTPPKPPDTSGRIIPDTKIAVHKLPGVDARLNYDTTGIKSSGGLPFERVSLGLELKNGELNLEHLRFRTADGDVDLNARYNPFTREGPPHLVANVDIRHIDLHKLLSGPSMPDFVKQTAGIAGGFIKIDTRGASMREFLAHMDGDAGIFMQNGQLSPLLEQIVPINVLGALGVYIVGGKPVQINCLVSRFDIKQGVATATTFLFDTDHDVVTAQGNVNFADETNFLRLVPYNKGFTVVTLRSPVDVRGTFKKPEFHVEVGGLIARLGAAVGLGVLFPPAALLPLIDVGLGEHNVCAKAYAAQPPPGNPEPKTGTSAPPQR